jgi:hypothetical protein
MLAGLRGMPRSARAVRRENALGRPLASAYIRDSTHRTREPSRIVMSAARRRFLARLAPAVLLSALAGCGHESTGGFAPVTVTRATAVTVHDALDAPVAAADVFALRLDAVGMLLAAPTDALGIARFTLSEGRWAVSTRVGGGAAPAQVAGSIGRVPGSGAGVPDTVLFRLRLATESFATGQSTLAGRADHSGTIVSAVEFPLLAGTDASGAWTLGGLPPGVWTGYATHLGFKTAVFDLVVPAPDDTIAIAPDVLQPETP